MMFNYSVVDYAGGKKKPYYWIRQSQQPRCLRAVESDDGCLERFAANGTRDAFSGEYRITRLDEAGSEYEHAAGAFETAANTSARLAELEVPESRSLLLIRWRSGATEGVNHAVTGPRPFDFGAYKNWVAHLDRLYGLDS